MAQKKQLKDKTIVSVILDNKVLDEVEEFKFEERFANRSQAICKLIEYGFHHYKENIEKTSKASEEFESSLLEGLENLIATYKGR